MAAAAASSRGGGLTGARTTKGLFFIFTLLLLVCIASSLTDQDKLEDYKSRISFLYDFLDKKFKEMDLKLILLEHASADFPPLLELIEITKRFTKNVYIYMKRKEENFAEEIENGEKKLEEMRNFIKFHEANQAEL
ncbi:hypothetical protein EXN66_Car013302 [Channa argus]|uniref:Uncharacterized protein n=1 Tax=Channa argus TaxID=215402 RepID=A0A6G1Q539_CHAAH|nr:hypothetical protein EXN66_Car013302 [Channa argus]